tara:strand:+ start:2549 stop:4219 length:1671 start_codon:yes stop_codon:yes gene_type:complete
MTEELGIALAQINPTVGDILGNLDIIRSARKSVDGTSDIVVTGELAVSGYPPEDLVLKPAFLEMIETEVNKLALETNDGGPALLIGAPWRENGELFNAALLLADGAVVTKRYKHVLPTYGVFDEDRVFSRGPIPGPIAFKGVRLGVMICEDMWKQDVAEGLQESGAEILIVINGSPYEIDKPDQRMNFAVGRVSETGLPLAYVNLVGGQDELVFDGGSFILNQKHALKAQAKAWEPQLVQSKWALKAEGWTCNEGTLEINTHDTVGQLHAIYHAIVLGLRDYVNKNSFPGVIMGLSGGIDSALSAAVAVDAIGSENVHCVMMPSPFTSQESLEDAAEIAGILGVAYDIIPIHEAMTAFDKMLTSVFQNYEADATEENIQARARGMIVMALSNKLGYLPLTTGNKSEMSVGYATLYGDMCGGYSVLKDIYKTTVFAISRWRNEIRPSNVFGGEGCVIPERIISKKPSAELKPDQFDEDTLPPYEVLDDILKNLIEGEQAISDIVARGHDPNVVRRVWHMLDRAEYKRRQAPPGVKISSRSFGRDRRYPITNGFTNLL